MTKPILALMLCLVSLFINFVLCPRAVMQDTLANAMLLALGVFVLIQSCLWFFASTPKTQDEIREDLQYITADIEAALEDLEAQFSEVDELSLRDEVALDILCAFLANPERYKFISGIIVNGHTTQDEATMKNIRKAFMIADTFLDIRSELEIFKPKDKA